MAEVLGKERGDIFEVVGTHGKKEAMPIGRLVAKRRIVDQLGVRTAGSESLLRLLRQSNVVCLPRVLFGYQNEGRGCGRGGPVDRAAECSPARGRRHEYRHPLRIDLL
jgi:hypothetical protein